MFYGFCNGELDGGKDLTVTGDVNLSVGEVKVGRKSELIAVRADLEVREVASSLGIYTEFMCIEGTDSKSNNSDSVRNGSSACAFQILMSAQAKVCLPDLVRWT